MDRHNNPNRLINEQSPYLLQHAYNPVDWFAWKDEAFEKAKIEDKPIFLSIGYSTCHWCHVMEIESFEDETVAHYLNQNFVAIKVDREERNDIDAIYMLVCQMMTGSGGWPLSIFMTPDKQPFFAGTYFPKENRYGRIGFLDLLTNIHNAWINNKNEIINSANEITKSLQQINSNSSDAIINDITFDFAFEYFEKRFDEEYGGFGSAPKFPSPHNLMFLLRYWKQTGNEKALLMVTKTLTGMGKGGIYDHIGFGFHRYSTDKQWLVPHFEKMLYDQAMMIIAYAEAYQATHNIEFKIIAEEIIQYVFRDLKSEDDEFYSAEDADSEGIEGKFYLWTKEEIKTVLNEEETELFSDIYGITAEGNFIEESAKEETGYNIPNLKNSLNELPKVNGYSIEEIRLRVTSIKKKLFEYRERRIHPFKDDKILTDWNALMITALAIAGRIFDNNEYIDAAIKSYESIQNKLFNAENILLHRYRNGSSDIYGNLDDYAFLIWASIELYQSTFEPYYIAQSIQLTEHTIKHFEDREYGGFYLTPGYGEKLIVRTKEIYDGAIPSGNSVMAFNLIRLARITSDSKYDQHADKLFKAFGESINNLPGGSTFLMIAFNYVVNLSYEIIISCKNYSNEVKDIINELNSRFIPNKVVIVNSEEKKLPFEYLANYRIESNNPLIYVCRNYQCNLPVTTVSEAINQINKI